MLLLMCVCPSNKSCTIINKNSKNAAKVWNYTNHFTAKKRPWRWTIYWIFSKENYVFVSVSFDKMIVMEN
jgi:hypothetical protein